MSEITLDGITKRFGSLTAVNDLSITIPDNSYTMILGPSGCGKSTTLRMLAGLEIPTEGEIRFGDERVNELPAQHRDLSMVFQSLALWDHKTVRENIAFGLKMEDVPKDERSRRTEAIAETLQISDKLDDSPVALSGGQQQRVALGRSLVREPEVVLLDEPLASLDAKLRIEMRTELLRIQQRTGVSFVHVTHSQEDAMSIADEIVLLNGGELQQFGDPLDLFENPTNRFVADFIGTPSMNLFEASFVDGDRITFDIAGFEFSVGTKAADVFRQRIDRSEIEMGIRPSNLTIVTNGEKAISFDATVSVVETYGDTNWYYLDTGHERDIVMKSADEDVLGSLDTGDQVSVGTDLEDIHVFDPATGEAQL